VVVLVDFTATTVKKMDMLKIIVIRRRRRRRRRLIHAEVVVPHRVLIVLLLDPLRVAWLVLRHRRYSCCFVG